MPLIRTEEDAETFNLALLAMTDVNVVRSFKTASERSNEKAAELCLGEMTRRNLTFVLTFSPEELRAAACLARTQSACRIATAIAAGLDKPPPRTALDRIASYWDAAADKAEKMSRSATVGGERLIADERISALH